MRLGLNIGVPTFGALGKASILTGPTWVDNGDGTATITFTTDIPTYAGVDYGTASGVYTESSFDVDHIIDTSHSVVVPDPLAGGTLADGTYYYRIWMNAVSTGATSYSAEGTGVISTVSALLLAAGGSDFLLLAAGGSDKLLRAS